MRIGGIQKLSLIDYPQKLAAVLFTQGCSFRCQFCHNPSLVKPELFDKNISEEEIFHFLEKRKKQLEAVVISGGEPTLQQDLISFIQKIKNFGYLIKLDTSGINPDILQELTQKKLIDYIAMDIKAPFNQYSLITHVPCNMESIQKSIQLLIHGTIPYEFRTTLVPSLHTLEDIVSMAQMIKNAKLYILQTFQDKVVLNPKLKGQKAFSKEEIEPYLKQALQFVKECKIR
jgi:pyruvate formate lyase activating enzyme